MNEQETSRLVVAAQAGDRAAFAELAAAHRARLLGAAWRDLGDREEALDAVQETLARALTKLPTLRAPAAFPLWLERICRNCCRQAKRRKRRRREVPLREAALVAADPGGGTAGQVLAGVAPRQRLVLERFYLEGRSIAELAERLGRPPGTIKRWLHEGRAMAKQSAAKAEKPVALVFGRHLSKAELAAVRGAVRDAGLVPRDLPPLPQGIEVVKRAGAELLVLGRRAEGPCESFEFLAARGTLGLREVPVLMLGPGEDEAVFTAWAAEVACYLSRPAARGEVATFIRRLMTQPNAAAAKGNAEAG